MPAFIVGAGLLFWGWESSNLLLAVPLAIAVELLRRLELRFDLEPASYHRLADLCTVAFVVLAAVLLANRGVPHGVLAAFQYLPLVLAPIVLAQYASSERRIRLSALFRYLRKLKAREPDTRDPLVDVSAAYLALSLLAAGMANQRGETYYFAVLGFAAWALCPRRPLHAPIAASAVLFIVAASLGYAGQLGLSRAQEALEDWVSEWQLRQDTDPSRASTDMGTLGRLKQHDAILLRVHAPAGENAGVKLLHRSSFNTFIGNTWLARNAPLAPIDADVDGASFRLAPGAAGQSLRISAKSEAGRVLLPLPTGTRRVSGLAGASLRASALGGVLVEAPESWISYDAAYGAELAHYAPAAAVDTVLPVPEREVLQRLAGELGLRGQPAAEVVRRVSAHLTHYSYSTFRESAVPAGTTALADFLTRTRSGHCEYFAAATVLLLRAGGVPARYATGFAVPEYSELEGAWVVRARHAHAWARAWVDGRWVELDNTPPSWVAEEASDAPLWQPLADLLRWAGFRWSQRDEGAPMSDWWYALAALLFAVLAWRIVKGRHSAAVEVRNATHAVRNWQGEDSEFYALEAMIAVRHGARAAGETHAAWLARIQPDAALQARALGALALHQRYRFDPEGIGSEARGTLRDLCRVAQTPGAA